MTELRIRKATFSDANTIADFNRAMAFETEQLSLNLETVLSGVRNLMQQPDYGFYLLAETSDAVVGSLMITHEWSDWRNGLFWWIQSVYVRPDYRRHGIYRRLYEHVKKQAAGEEAVRGFRLYVDRHNTTAQKVYRALGMEETNYRLFETLR